MNSIDTSFNKVMKRRYPTPQGRDLVHFPALRQYVMSLRKIPAATFRIGNDAGSQNERPTHSVTIKEFSIGRTPVTVKIWKEYCYANGMPFPKIPDWGWIDDFPIVNVSWNDIMGRDGKGGFAAWASHVAGVTLSLPREAQFEYAACGGKVGIEFPWGSEFDSSYLWCSEAMHADAVKPAGVFRKSRNYINAFRLTDMVGNVQQWCSDGYLPHRSDFKASPNIRQMPRATPKVIRGFGWNELDPETARCSARYSLPPDSISNTLGFRLAGPSG